MISRIRGGNYRNYGKPVGYNTYRWPYSTNTVLPGSIAHATFEVLSTTLANFDGQTLGSFVILPTGGVAVNLTFDDDAAPPSTSTAIKIMGLTTLSQIAEQLALALSLNGYRVRQDGAKVFVYQPVIGDQGNLEIAASAGLAGDLSINDKDPAAFNVFFFGGFTLVPELWGPQRGFRAINAPQVPYEAAPV